MKIINTVVPAFTRSDNQTSSDRTANFRKYINLIPKVVKDSCLQLPSVKYTVALIFIRSDNCIKILINLLYNQSSFDY